MVRKPKGLWVREVLDPEPLPSDDAVLLIFLLVAFLCIRGDKSSGQLGIFHLLTLTSTSRKSPKRWIPAWWCYLLSLSLSVSLVKCGGHWEEVSPCTAFSAASARTCALSLALCTICRVPLTRVSLLNAAAGGTLRSCGERPQGFSGICLVLLLHASSILHLTWLECSCLASFSSFNLCVARIIRILVLLS